MYMYMSHVLHTLITFLKRTRSYIRTPFRIAHSSPSNKQLHGELPLSNSTLKAGRGEAYTLTHMRRSEAHATHAPHLATRSTLEREHERHLPKVYGTKKAETIAAWCSPTLLFCTKCYAACASVTRTFKTFNITNLIAHVLPLRANKLPRPASEFGKGCRD